jgi:hypothetical protein
MMDKLNALKKNKRCCLFVCLLCCSPTDSVCCISLDLFCVPRAVFVVVSAWLWQIIIDSCDCDLYFVIVLA